MRPIGVFVALVFFLAPAARGQTSAGKPAEPFKVGTFEIRKTPTVALVLRDSLIVDIDAANRAVPNAAKVAAPRDMIELIERYDSGLRPRLYEIVNYLAANNVPHIWQIDVGAHTFPVWKNDLYHFASLIFK